MKVAEFLRHIPLFHHLHGEDRERLAGSMTSQALAKGEVLFQKGSVGDALFIIKDGKVKVSLSSHTGDEVILAIFSEGDFFGEMALLDGMPRSADVTAIEPTELLRLKREDFFSFLNNNSNAVQAIFQSLSRRLRSTDDLLEDTCFLNISARFAKKLLEMAQKNGYREGDAVRFDLTLTQKDMASMVGATRESINKELRLLREKGLLAIQGNSIIIHDLTRLKRRAR